MALVSWSEFARGKGGTRMLRICRVGIPALTILFPVVFVVGMAFLISGETIKLVGRGLVLISDGCSWVDDWRLKMIGAKRRILELRKEGHT